MSAFKEKAIALIANIQGTSKNRYPSVLRFEPNTDTKQAVLAQVSASLRVKPPGATVALNWAKEAVFQRPQIYAQPFGQKEKVRAKGNDVSKHTLRQVYLLCSHEMGTQNNSRIPTDS